MSTFIIMSWQEVAAKDKFFDPFDRRPNSMKAPAAAAEPRLTQTLDIVKPPS